MLDPNADPSMVPAQPDPQQGMPAAPGNGLAGQMSPQGVPAGGMGAPMQPPAAPQMLHDITVVRSKKYAYAKVMAVPPEEFGIARRARSLRPDDCNYCYHEVVRFEAQLIAEGYDAKQLKTIPSADVFATGEQHARDTVEEFQHSGDTINDASRPIKVCEHYVRMDYKKNGKPALYMVTTGGNQADILKKDGVPQIIEVDEHPFAAWSPIIQTHRFYGRSEADLVMDIQRIKTALLRALLDNAYLANNQRLEMSEAHAGKNTLDDLLVNRPGGIVRTKQPGGLVPIPNNPIGPFVFPLLEYMDATRDARTGLTKDSQGIDSNALQNQTATAVNTAFAAAQARLKLIARIAAETGIKDLFSKLHGVIRKNEREQKVVRLRNKWVTVDPRDWKMRNDLTINVGLGTGTKDQQVMHLMNLLSVQQQAYMAGLASPKNLYTSLKKLPTLLGMKNADTFFTDPDSPEGQQAAQAKAQAAQNDPKMAAVQAKAQSDAAALQSKSQVEMQRAQLDAQLNTQKAQQEAQIEVIQARADIATQQNKMASEMQKMQADFALKLQQHRLDMAMKVNDHVLKAKERRDQQAHSQQMDEHAAASDHEHKQASSDNSAQHHKEILDAAKMLLDQAKAMRKPRKVTMQHDAKTGKKTWSVED